MGTEVSQIACGRKHSLAFVPTRGRVYAFGLGGSGQLGQSTYNSTTTPQVVHGSWVGPSGEPTAPKRILSDITHSEKVIVIRIGAGGDQSFVIVQDPKSKPLDFRDADHLHGIEILNKGLIKEMNSKGNEDLLDQEFIEKLEVIFQNPACINASLLLEPTHKPCTSKNNGIDMVAWSKTTFNFYFELKNETIIDVITTGLTKYILPKLECNPPDVETLRQFLILPLFTEFESESLYKEVHCVYAKGFISLPKAAMNVVEKWFVAQGKDYFLSIVKNYKKAVIHILEKQHGSSSDADQGYERDLGFCLVFLRVLSRINVNHGCQIVSYEDFYIPQISQYLELPDAYIRWIIAKSRGIGKVHLKIRRTLFTFKLQTAQNSLYFDEIFFFFLQLQTNSISAISPLSLTRVLKPSFCKRTRLSRCTMLPSKPWVKRCSAT